MPDEANAPADPIGALAEAAAGLHEMFTAYVDAGFSRGEALQIVIAVVTANIRPPEQS